MNYKGGIVVSYWYLETEDTMKDYAVVILDLPPLDGNEPVEEELKESNAHWKVLKLCKSCGFFFEIVKMFSWGILEASLFGDVQLKKEYLYIYI